MTNEYKDFPEDILKHIPDVNVEDAYPKGPSFPCEKLGKSREDMIGRGLIKPVLFLHYDDPCFFPRVLPYILRKAKVKKGAGKGTYRVLAIHANLDIYGDSHVSVRGR